MPNLMQLVQLSKAWHDICNIKLIWRAKVYCRESWQPVRNI